MRRNADRRSHPRAAVIARAYIVDADSSITGCSLLDLSYSGAKLKLPYGSTVQGQLTLCIPSKGIERPIEVVWRSSDQIGVVFSMNILGRDEALAPRTSEPPKPISVDQLRKLALNAIVAEPSAPAKRPLDFGAPLTLAHSADVWRRVSASAQQGAAEFTRIIGGKARVSLAAAGEETALQPDALAEHLPQLEGVGEDAFAPPQPDVQRLLFARRRWNIELTAAAAALLLVALPAAFFILPGASANAPADHHAEAVSAAAPAASGAERAAATDSNAPAAAAAPAVDPVAAPAEVARPAEGETDSAVASATQPQESPPQGDDLLQPLPSLEQAPAASAARLGAATDVTALWFQNAPVTPCLNYGQFTAPQAFQEIAAGPCETAPQPPATDAPP